MRDCRIGKEEFNQTRQLGRAQVNDARQYGAGWDCERGPVGEVGGIRGASRGGSRGSRDVLQSKA